MARAERDSMLASVQSLRTEYLTLEEQACSKMIQQELMQQNWGLVVRPEAEVLRSELADVASSVCICPLHV